MGLKLPYVVHDKSWRPITTITHLNTWSVHQLASRPAIGGVVSSTGMEASLVSLEIRLHRISAATAS